MKDTGTAGRVENPPRSQEMARGRPDGNMSGPPRHIAIIMDGNGRWATKRGLPRTIGHKAGAETFRRIVNHPALRRLPMLLETPNELPGYAAEIALLRGFEEAE